MYKGYICHGLICVPVCFNVQNPLAVLSSIYLCDIRTSLGFSFHSFLSFPFRFWEAIIHILFILKYFVRMSSHISLYMQKLISCLGLSLQSTLIEHVLYEILEASHRIYSVRYHVTFLGSTDGPKSLRIRFYTCIISPCISVGSFSFCTTCGHR